MDNQEVVSYQIYANGTAEMPVKGMIIGSEDSKPVDNITGDGTPGTDNSTNGESSKNETLTKESYPVETVTQGTISRGNLVQTNELTYPGLYSLGFVMILMVYIIHKLKKSEE